MGTGHTRHGRTHLVLDGPTTNLKNGHMTLVRISMSATLTTKVLALDYVPAFPLSGFRKCNPNEIPQVEIVDTSLCRKAKEAGGPNRRIVLSVGLFGVGLGWLGVGLFRVRLGRRREG